MGSLMELGDTEYGLFCPWDSGLDDMGNGGLNSKAMFSEKKKRSKLRKGR